jgi:hypothetical protein
LVDFDLQLRIIIVADVTVVKLFDEPVDHETCNHIQVPLHAAECNPIYFIRIWQMPGKCLSRKKAEANITAKCELAGYAAWFYVSTRLSSVVPLRQKRVIQTQVEFVLGRLLSDKTRKLLF